MKKFWLSGFIFFSLLFGIVLLAIWQIPDNNLHIVFCNVGQGDAILVFKGTTQMLFDGGPDNSVLSCLSKYMPFWDREIEVTLATHSDADHIKGLLEVLKRFKVDRFVSTGFWSGTNTSKALIDELKEKNTEELFVDSKSRLSLAQLKIDILWPSSYYLAVRNGGVLNHSQVLSAKTSDSQTNDLSIVSLVSFGKFDALLTGDAQQEAEEGILEAGFNRSVEVLKVSHHGSKNGLIKEFLETVKPNLAVISVGKNSYGHPHKEILEMLESAGVRVLRTDQLGDIEVVSDGERWWVR